MECATCLPPPPHGRARLDRSATLMWRSQHAHPGAPLLTRADIDIRGVVVAVDVADDRDDARAAVGQPGEVHRVVAGVVREVGGGHHPRALEQVALGVLHREDPLVLGQPHQ